MAMSTEELMAAVCPKIRDVGWAHYFVPETIERGAELGLDVGGFYFMGRGGVLGDVEWPVVHSVFGYFNPDTVRDAWTAGCKKVAPRDAGRAYIECCRDLGRRKLSGLSGLGAFCEAACAVNDAAEVVGLTLYAAAAAEPLAPDLPAKALQLVSLLRELRGSAHLLSVVTSRLSPKEAHFMARPEFMSMFGWPEGDVPEIGEEQREKLRRAEVLTDEIVGPAYSVLGEEGSAALLSGIETIEAALAA
ncbi:MAG: SCO6745 family protein [Acidimicrobiales bacterium]